MHTGSTGPDLTACGIELAELHECGLRMVRHEFADDLLPLDIQPRGIAPARGLRGISTWTAKPHDQRAHNTWTDGKTLGQLTDGALLTVVGAQNLLASISRRGFHVVYWHPVALEAGSAGRRFSGRESREPRLTDCTSSLPVEL